MDDARQNLTDDLAAERARRGLTWVEVARALGMSAQNLARIRAGEISVSPGAGRAIERFLRWKPGSVAARLEGGQPEPVEPVDPITTANPVVPGCPASAEAAGGRHEWSAESRHRILAMSVEDILDFGRQIRATGGDRAAILWLREATRIKAEAPAIRVQLGCPEA